MSHLFHDFRYGSRMLFKNPGFTAIATLILALGIGANTAVYSVVNALLFHPYPFHHLEQLVLVGEPGPAGTDAGNERRVAAADFFDLRRQTQVFQSLTAYQSIGLNLSDNGGMEGADAVAVLPNFFDVLGVHPAVGRSLGFDEEQQGRDNVLIISDGFWKERYGQDPRLVGKQIRVNGRVFTVIGIMPPHFRYPAGIDVWVPLALSAEEKLDRATSPLSVFGRLKPRVSPTQALAELGAFSARLQQEFPKTNAGRTISLLPMRQEQYQYTAPIFLMLQVAALFVLVLACANLTNLLLSRFIARQKEIAIRIALGADRKGVTEVLLAEVILLALLAASTAIAVSFWTVKLVRDSLPAGMTKWIAGWEGIQVNASVLGFALLTTFAMGIVVGLGTAFRSVRTDPNDALKEGGGGLSAGRSKHRLRNALIVTQVIFAMVLLVGAALMIGGFLHLMNVYAGFQPDLILTMQITLPEKKYPEDLRIRAFYDQLLRGMKFLPGVESAAVVRNIPASNVDNDAVSFTMEGRPVTRSGELWGADQQPVSPDFFRVLRIPILEGRGLSEGDDHNSPPVAVISQSMASQFWPDQNPIGKRLKFGTGESLLPWISVVGVVGDVKQNWFDPRPRPTLYVSYLQTPKRSMNLVLRTKFAPLALAGPTRSIVQRIDPEIAISGIQAMDGVIRDSISPVRLMGILMTVFGAVALTLSAIGLYGVLSQAVTQRIREFGIRLTLGARPGELLRLVLGQSLRLCGIGLVVAVPLSLALGRLMASLLFGVVALKAGMLLALALVVIALALVAGLLPACRAMRVDPMVALRYE